MLDLVYFDLVLLGKFCNHLQNNSSITFVAPAYNYAPICVNNNGLELGLKDPGVIVDRCQLGVDGHLIQPDIRWIRLRCTFLSQLFVRQSRVAVWVDPVSWPHPLDSKRLFLRSRIHSLLG